MKFSDKAYRMLKSGMPYFFYDLFANFAAFCAIFAQKVEARYGFGMIVYNNILS